MTQSQRRAATAAYRAIEAIADARTKLTQAGIDVYTDPGYAKLDRTTEAAKRELTQIAQQLVGDPEAEEFVA